MTVQELRDAMAKMPGDTPIVIRCQEYSGPILDTFVMPNWDGKTYTGRQTSPETTHGLAFIITADF